MRVSAGRLVQGFSALGHLYIHLFTAFYAVMVLALERDWQLPYHELIALWTIPSFLVGVGAVPAGWLADRWSASGMMAVFFLGIGASSIVGMFATGLVIDLAGWRAAFMIPGAISIATGIAFVILIRGGRIQDGTIVHREPPVSRGDMVRAFIVLLVIMLINGIIFQSMQTAAPKLGSATGDILGELGYTPAEIGALKAKGVVG